MVDLQSKRPSSYSKLKTKPHHSRGGDIEIIQRHGRQLKEFDSLSPRTKHDRARDLTNDYDLNSLLMAAEKSARLSGKTATAKVLNSLVNCTEEYSTRLLNATKDPVSVVSSLSLKNELCLSKSKYSTMSRFLKLELGYNVLQPWATIIRYRNEIIPKFTKPDRTLGFLSVKASLRDMVENHMTRFFECYPDILHKISSSKNDDNCVRIVLRITGGIDSATGFTQYNHSDILGEDSSLLVSNFMLLSIENEKGQEIWRNSRPQSNSMVRPLMMAWTKETAEITLSVYNEFMDDVDELNSNPIIIEYGEMQVKFNIMPSYTLIDGKAANAIVENKNTHKCPLCCNNNAKPIGPSYMHSTINCVEWLIKHRAKVVVNGRSLTVPEVTSKVKEFSRKLEKQFGLQVNRAQPGGTGNSNTGNMAKKLLSKPNEFAKCLELSSAEPLEGLKLLSVLSCSSKPLNSTMVEDLYDKTIAELRKAFPDLKICDIPPCIEKYRHLAELSRYSVKKILFIY